MNVTKDEVVKSITLQTGAQATTIPANLTIRNEVMPVILLHKFANLHRSAPLTNGTSATLLTTDSDKDFYVTGAYLSVIKDVTSTSVLSSISATVNSYAQRLLGIAGISLTPQSETISINYSYPLKIDRGTAITLGNSTNVANITANGGIFGFYL